MLSKKEIEQRVNQVHDTVGIKIDELIDEYGIEAVVNVLASICIKRGRSMMAVPQPNNRSITLSKKYIKNGVKLLELDTFHKQIEIAPNEHIFIEDDVSDAKLREKIERKKS